MRPYAHGQGKHSAAGVGGAKVCKAAGGHAEVHDGADNRGAALVKVRFAPSEVAPRRTDNAGPLPEDRQRDARGCGKSAALASGAWRVCTAESVV